MSIISCALFETKQLLAQHHMIRTHKNSSCQTSAKSKLWLQTLDSLFFSISISFTIQVAAIIYKWLHSGKPN